MASGQPTLYTVGHGARSIQQFLALLRNAGVKQLVDIRRWPTSKTAHFKSDEMKNWLQEAGIQYIWMGERLGGYRSGGYEKYMKTDEFKIGIKDLLAVVEKGRTCIMCLEVSPKACHRRFVSKHLSERGVKVIHIISEKKVEHSQPNRG